MDSEVERVIVGVRTHVNAALVQLAQYKKAGSKRQELVEKTMTELKCAKAVIDLIAPQLSTRRHRRGSEQNPENQ